MTYVHVFMHEGRCPLSLCLAARKLLSKHRMQGLINSYVSKIIHGKAYIPTMLACSCMYTLFFDKPPHANSVSICIGPFIVKKNTLLHNKRTTNNYKRIVTTIMARIAIAMGKQLPSTHEHYSVPLCALSHKLCFVQLPNKEEQDLPHWHPKTSHSQFLLILDLPREICNTNLNVSIQSWASYYFVVTY